MPRTVTEVCNLSFTPETNIPEIIAKSMPIFERQVPAGLRSLKWGIWEDDRTKVQMMIHWDDLTSHTAFMQSADYPGLLGLLDGHLTAAPDIFHVHFEGGDSKINEVLSGPVVELVTFFCVKEEFDEAIGKAVAVGGQSEGCLGNVMGDVVEEIAPSEGEAKGKAKYMAVAWTSVQAHSDANAQEEVARTGERVVSSVGGCEVHHVRFQ